MAASLPIASLLSWLSGHANFLRKKSRSFTPVSIYSTWRSRFFALVNNRTKVSLRTFSASLIFEKNVCGVIFFVAHIASLKLEYIDCSIKTSSSPTQRVFNRGKICLCNIFCRSTFTLRFIVCLLYFSSSQQQINHLSSHVHNIGFIRIIKFLLILGLGLKH